MVSSLQHRLYTSNTEKTKPLAIGSEYSDYSVLTTKHQHLCLLHGNKDLIRNSCLNVSQTSQENVLYRTKGK